MKLTTRIDSDCRCLENYFRKLFVLLAEAQAEDETAPIEAQDYDADDSQATYHGFSHLIKPDMLMNIYSLVDYWLSEICEHHKKTHHLSLSYRDIKGKNELQARHKYLTVYAGLNLDTVQTSYKQLDDLRKIRNTFMHGGGHVPTEKEKEFSAINGIALSGSLIVIEDSFILETLQHAKTYFKAAVQA